jgi:hypothetical protein
MACSSRRQPPSSYFFKLTGPSDRLRAVHASFDALIGSVRRIGGL